MDELMISWLNLGLLEAEPAIFVAIFLPIFSALLITVFIPLIRKRQQEEKDAGGKDE